MSPRDGTRSDWSPPDALSTATGYALGAALPLATRSHKARALVVRAPQPNDLVLAMVHRAANFALGVAGLAEVKCAGVENFDVSGVVAAHHKYRHATSDVLSLIGLEDTV